MLRGSASSVLTATGFVNGKGQLFSTPYRIDTPQPITKQFVTGDYVGDPYGCAKLGTGHRGLLGAWVRYNQNYFYSYPLFGNSPTGQTRAKMCILEFFLRWSQFRGQKPQNSQFWGVNRRFKPNSRNRKTCILSKLLHRFQAHFGTVIKTTKCRWSRHTYHKSKMPDSLYLGKIRKIVISRPGSRDFDEIWHADAVRPSRPFRPLKIWHFDAILKNAKSRYLDSGLTDRHEIWHGDAIRHLWCVPWLEICNFRSPTWRHISVAVSSISTKFGRVTQFGPRDRLVRYKFEI